MKRQRFHTRQTTFRQLETFLAVAERLSVTEAARALHLAQPSVSTQIAKLEQALGMQLFERLHRVSAQGTTSPSGIIIFPVLRATSTC